MFELSNEELLAVSGGSRARANGGDGGDGGDGSATGGLYNVRVGRGTVTATANTTGGNGGAGGAGGNGGIAVATRNISV